MMTHSDKTTLTPLRISRDNCHINGLRELYESAFPPEEQIPYDELVALTDYDEFEYVAWLHDENLVGMTIVLRLPEVNWFWYFAVVEACRGKGYGQQILTTIKSIYSVTVPLILDMESPAQASPNHEQRLRRRAFYLRNGFRDTDTLKSYDGVDYTIMITGDGTFIQADYDRLIQQLRHYWNGLRD